MSMDSSRYGQIANGSVTIVTGSVKIASGSFKIASGSAQIANGSAEIGNGSVQIERRTHQPILWGGTSFREVNRPI
jgi:lipopolysaccharide export system protein LptA